MVEASQIFLWRLDYQPLRPGGDNLAAAPRLFGNFVAVN